MIRDKNPKQAKANRIKALKENAKKRNMKETKKMCIIGNVRLSKKEFDFIHYYMSTNKEYCGNGTACYIKAFYPDNYEISPEKRRNIWVYASQLLHEQRIKEAITYINQEILS